MKKEYLDESEFNGLKQIIETLVEKHKDKIVSDHGTCIMGEGIKIETKFKRERIVRPRQVYVQRFTQGSQESLIMAIIKDLREFFPSASQLIKYECGRMD